MKKISTTVGTSLIQNAIKNDKADVDDFDILRDKSYSFNSNEISNSKKNIRNDLNGIIKSSDKNLSAEISSIYKISEEIDDDFEVYLIATDTILSPICAECIKDFLKGKGFEIHFNENHDIIKGLQVKDKQEFNKNGLPNLLYRLDSISQEYWSNMIFNITGGYKGIIPFMTIIAQVNEVPVYYLFEENQDTKPQLISIPRIPISFDENIFEKYWQQFAFLEKEEIVSKANIDYSFLEEANSSLDIDKDSVMLNPVGKILWQKYKKQYFIFYCPAEVWNEIQNQNEIQRILNSKFHNSEARNNKTERKQIHYVYDDGNNDFRIYYFTEKDNLFIYRTFESEEKAKKFIDTQFDKNQIIEKSNAYKIKKQ